MPRAEAPVIAYSIDALVAEGFSRRKIRYYIEKKIMPPAHGRGPTAYYTDAHISILRSIKQAQDQRVYLADIAERSRFSGQRMRRHPG